MTNKNAETVTETQDIDTTTEAETTVEAVQLTMQDLQNLANVVDLACRRGAYPASDMESVGAVYNKLSSFLQHVAATQEKEAESNT